MYKTLAKIKTIQLLAVISTVVIAVCGLIVISGNVQAQSPPAAAAPGSTFDQRVAQRKAERNIVLAPRDQQRLVNVCVAAQSKVRVLQQKTTPAVAHRVKTHQQIDAKLWITTGKLKLAEKDTFKLERQRVAFADKINAFQQTSQNYNQALDDLVTVNCRVDPVGFKALLDTARIYRADVRTQSTGIRDYLNNEIKPSLGNYASDLQAKPYTGGGQ